MSLRESSLSPGEKTAMAAPAEAGRFPALPVRDGGLLSDLSRMLGGRASDGLQDRMAYARDLWPKAVLWARAGRWPQGPDAVCWPESAAEVQEVVRYAAQRGIPIVPYGAGSGVCGGAMPVRGGITLDLKRMDRLRAIDVEKLQIDAEAGLVGEHLERRLARRGLTLGHFPSSILCSTVGGWLAARGAGQCSTRYGKIEDMVASLEVVDGAGELRAISPRPSVGPDLGQLFIGCEGVLGIITSSRLYVHPQPKARAFQSWRFPTVEAGTEAIRRMMAAGLRPSVVRLYDPFDAVMAGRVHGGEPGPKNPRDSLMRTLQGKALSLALGRPLSLNRAIDLLRATLLVLVFEGDQELVAHEASAARELCLGSEGEDQGEGPARHWMESRYAVSFKQSGLFDGGGFVDTMEVACPWSSLMGVYRAVRRALAPHVFVMAHFSHAYLDGCSIYFTFAGAAGSEEELQQRYDQTWRSGLSAAMDAGATASHHHGIGLSKAQALVRELGPGGMRLLRAAKAVFDPAGIMNPGKLGLP